MNMGCSFQQKDCLALRRVVLMGARDNVPCLRKLLGYKPLSVCRNGYIAMSSPFCSFKVIDCYPFHYGYVDRNTEVVTVPSPCSPESRRACDEFWRSVCLLQYVLCLLVSASHPTHRSLFCCCALVRMYLRRLRVIGASASVMEQLTPSGVDLDNHSTVIVRSKTLHYLRVPCGSWCWCSVECDPAGNDVIVTGAREGRQRRRVLLLRLVCCHSSALTERAAVVAVSLLHAVDASATCAAARCNWTLSVLAQCQPEQLPVASCVKLAQLASPHQLDIERCSSVLRAYFCRECFVTPGHVLCVPLLHTQLQSTEQNSVCFRVESVSLASRSDHDNDVTRGALFRPGVTSLYQVSDVTATPAPDWPLLDTVLQHGMLPDGVQAEYEELCGIIRWQGSVRFSDHVTPPLVIVQCAADWLLLSLVRAATAGCGLYLLRLSAAELLGDTSGAICARLEQKLRPRLEASGGLAATAGGGARVVVALHNAEFLARTDMTSLDWRQLETLTDIFTSRRRCRSLLLFTPDADLLAPPLCARATHVLRVLPDGAAKVASQLARWLSRAAAADLSGVSAPELAQLLQDVRLPDLPVLVQRAKMSCLERYEQWSTEHSIPPLLCISRLCLDAEDISCGLALLHSRRGCQIGGVASIITGSGDDDCHTRWSDVGALSAVRQHVLDTVQLPLRFPRLFTGPLRRSGVLLYGAPGTGKTLVARAVASECQLNFISVKGPELINMYVGQSEANIRQVFNRARAASPCVIFFDELDSLAPSRGRTADAGGVMDRVVCQFLTELDAAVSSSSSPHNTETGAVIFVIGATNRPDLIEPALLRPGRFDKLLYLPPASTRHQQLDVLRAQTRRLDLAGDVDLEAVVERLAPTVTGADLFSVCEHATQLALEHAVSLVESGDGDEDSVSLQITQQHLEIAAAALKPSISDQQLREYEQLQLVINGSWPVS